MYLHRLHLYNMFSHGFYMPQEESDHVALAQSPVQQNIDEEQVLRRDCNNDCCLFVMLWPCMLRCAGQIYIRSRGIFGATEVWDTVIARGTSGIWVDNWEFEWTIFQALRAQIGAEEAARKAADDTERQANSGQNVQDEQGDGQIAARTWMTILIPCNQCCKTFVILGSSSPSSWQTPRAMRYYTQSMTTGTENGQSTWSGQSRSTMTLPMMPCEFM